MTHKQKLAVVGMGSSGQSAAKLASALGYRVLCIDRKETAVPAGCDFVLETDASIDGVDTIVVSPGVPPHNAVLNKAIELNIPIMSELNFAANYINVPMIAVTGTNGKSSTVWYTKQIAEQAERRVFLGGNFGCALSEMALDILDNKKSYDLAIVEVSSYQMEWSQDFHPASASILNLTPDHLARHGTLEEYKRCKLKLFEHQTGEDRAVLPLQPTSIHPRTQATKRFFGSMEHRKNQLGCFTSTQGLHWFGEHREWMLERSQISLLGEHNLQNIAAALLLLEPFIQIKPALCSTPTALEHRLESFTVNNRTWINDSKATNIEATEAALESMTEPVTLLMGGAGKQGANYQQLLTLLEKNTVHIICFGASGSEIHSQLIAVLSENILCTLTVDLSSAIQLARLEEDQRPVLLSPACASFDAFNNFEHRGRFFKKTLLALEAV